MVRVCVRVDPALDGGSVSDREPMDFDEPRSTWIHCGNALFALSQYVLASPSTAFAATKPWLELLAETGWCKARSVLPEGALVVTVTELDAADTLPAASCAV